MQFFKPRITVGCVAAAFALTVVAGAASAAASPTEITLRAPLDPFRLVVPFTAPASRWGAGHRGIDLASHLGQQVHAPANGVITFAGVVVDRPVVSISHSAGFVISVEPVESSLAVGVTVATGDVVGRIAQGLSHCRPQCLHLGIRQHSTYVDPLDMLDGFGRVLLLPTERHLS